MRFLLTYVLLTFGFIANAATVSVDVDNLRYTVDTEANTARLYAPVSSSTVFNNLVIPDYITYNDAQIPVTSIGNQTFYNNINLKGSLTIGNNVQTIGSKAFDGCTGFTGSLTIGNSVQTIGDYAFGNCNGFTGSLTIPNSVQTIGNWAFVNCTGFTGSLTIPDNVETIGEYAFQYCSGFTGSLVIPDNVQTIGEYAFWNCTGFTGSLTIGKSIQIIESGAFSGCSGFTGSLTIPNSVQTIGDWAFRDCSGFTGSLVIPDNVQTIREYAFFDCTGFTGSLVIPDNVQTIGSHAFFECTGFTGSLTIGNSVQTIGSNAFYGCTGFTGSLTIGNSVQTIGSNAFYGCTGFTGSLVIPDNVETIGSGAFQYCSGFTDSLTIGDNVLTIGSVAFYGCTGFTSLFLPSSIKSYGSALFADMPLKEITCLADNPPIIQFATFSYNTRHSACLYVPSQSVPKYKSATYWRDFDCINNIKVLPTSMSVKPTETILYIGDTFELDIIILPLEAEDADLDFTSSNVKVASVDEDGIITALCEGETTITVETENGLTATCEVTVMPVPAKSIILSAENLTILVGQSDKLTATVLPENTTDKTITWKSDNEAIATIGADGTVTGVSVGTAIITATCGEATATCKVTVNPVLATTVTISIPDKDVFVGDKITLAASITPENTTDKTLVWTSETPAIATIDATSGELTAIAPGEAKIKVACGDVSATATITVKPILAQSVRLSADDITLLVGASQKLTATIEPENSTDKTITWKSDNEAIATVGADGTVTGVSVGVANITATCGEASATCKVTVNPVVSSSITLNVQNMTLLVGQTDKLTATVLPENTTDKTVTWKSDNEAIATVGADGTVKGVSVGVANITATCGEASATCKVTVNPVVSSSITLNVQNMTLLVGQSDKLTATVLPENTTDKTITWKSDNEAIATVGADGTVTGVSVGIANITATCGEASATCKVTVNPVVSSSITLNVQDMTLLVGQSDKLTATVLPENTTDKTITWKSDNEAIATVGADGTVTGVSVGVANITATCGEASAICKVTVNPVVASSITLNVQDMTLLVGQTDKLTATVLPDNTTDKTITWKSDNEAIATVGADGTVTGVSVGVANITATCGQASATCKVTVNPVVSSSITLNVQNMTLLVGQSDKLTATVLPENTTDKTITWKSDNEAIATVGADGTVTGVSVGVANITATCGEASATCKVTVNPVVSSSITLNVQAMTLLVGQSDKLTATVLPENTTDKTITWKSDNEAIATVGADGTVTGVSVGVANITATCGEASATCKVTVNPVEVSSIELSLQDVTLLIGSTTTLTAKVYPENATVQTITWTSADPTIASIDDSGTISALQVGETTVTATCGEVSASCKVTVTAVAPSSIELNIKDMVLFIGQSETIQAIVRPANTTYPTVTWQSGDEKVATVTADGKVTGISEGVVTITASCGEVSAECTVTVNPIPASNIEITTGDVTLTIGNSTTLLAKVLPENTTHPDVEWVSSDPDIATITADGIVTGINIGTAIITAKCGNVSATCTVTVIPVPSEGIIISPTSVSMLLGDEVTLTASVFPENTTDKNITWGSDNPGVASVSSNGVVKALNLGTATITASNGSSKASCIVTVNPIVATSISLNVKDETIFVASTTQLVATISPANVTDKTITWTSSKPEIATVTDDGLVYGVAVGTTTITATIGSVSTTCQINVVHRIPDMDPSVTTSERDIKTISGRQVNMAVYPSGGEPTGWSYSWTKNGEIVSRTTELNITAINDSETVIAEIYRVKVENEIDKVVIFSEVYDFVVQIYPAIDDNQGDIDIIISTGNGSSNKTREGNIVNLSVKTPDRGNPQGWEYLWSDANGEIGNEESVETIATMSSGSSMDIEKTTYKLNMINYSPDGDVWAQFNVESNLEVYRRPQTPLQLLRKGDGTSHTFVVMMPLSDSQLEQLNYSFVYGWTDSEGKDHILEQTKLRYCHTSEEIYNNSSNKFWAYSLWNYQDGCIVSSGLCYLDGSIDESFDASVFDGSYVNNEMGTKSRKAVYRIDGQYMGESLNKLLPGIYIVITESNGVKSSQKVVIL